VENADYGSRLRHPQPPPRQTRRSVIGLTFCVWPEENWNKRPPFAAEEVFMNGRMRFALASYLTAVAVATTFTGCGTSEYNSMLNSRLDKLRAGAPFRVLWGPTSLPDTPVSLRVPLIFNKSYVEDSPHSEDGPKIRPDRLQPPFLQIPGLKICYEGKATDAQLNGKLPFFCYLGAMAAKPGDADALAADLAEKLKQKFKDAPAEWQNIDAKTPDDKAMTWRKIRVEGDQEFPTRRGASKDGVPIVTETFPGVFELWMYDAGQYVVLVGWRAPKSIEGPSTTPTPANATEALLRRPSSDKIDLGKLPILTAGSLQIQNAAEGAAAPEAQ
jgi:hypothetical protein